MVLLENELTRESINGTIGSLPYKSVLEQVHDKAISSENLHSIGTDNILAQVREANRRDLKKIRKGLIQYESKLRDKDAITEEDNEILQTQIREVNEAIRDWRIHPKTINRLRTLFTSAENMTLNPGHQAAMFWRNQQISDHRKEATVWTGMKPNSRKLDSNFSFFTSKVTNDCFIFETVYGCGSLHQEMMFSQIWRLGAFDIREGRIKTHLIWSGPAQAGKSFVQGKVIKWSIPGTYIEVVRQTQNAYTTDINHNNKLMVLDEMGNQFFNTDDKTEGDSNFKSMLTNKKMKTETCEIDPVTKKRHTIYYEAEMDIQLNGCMNAVAASFAPPMRSRCLIWDVVRRDRPGLDMSLKGCELNADYRDREVEKNNHYENQLLQCHVQGIELCIQAEFLPDVDMTAALMHKSGIKLSLNSNGKVVEYRRESQIENQSRGNCLYEAAHRLFFSDLIFHKDPVTGDYPEFKPEMYLEAIPYLFVNEQHLIFAITGMKHLIIDSNADIIGQAIYDLSMEGGSVCYDDLAVDKNDPSQPDYDFIFMKVNESGNDAEIGRETLIKNAAANKILNHIRTRYGLVVLYSSVVSVLNWMMEESLEVRHYTDENKQGAQYMRLNLMKIRPRSLNRTGLAVNRIFVMGCKTRTSGGKDLMQDAIEDNFTKHTVERSLITGVTYRDSQNAMYPFLLKSIQFKSNPKKPTRVRNLKYRTAGFSNIIHQQHHRPNEEQCNYIEIDTDIDTYCYTRFAENNALPILPLNFPVDRSGEGARSMTPYPDYYMKENDKERDWAMGIVALPKRQRMATMDDPDVTTTTTTTTITRKAAMTIAAMFDNMSTIDQR